MAVPAWVGRGALAGVPPDRQPAQQQQRQHRRQQWRGSSSRVARQKSAAPAAHLQHEDVRVGERGVVVQVGLAVLRGCRAERRRRLGQRMRPDSSAS